MIQEREPTKEYLTDKKNHLHLKLPISMCFNIYMKKKLCEK